MLSLNAIYHLSRLRIYNARRHAFEALGSDRFSKAGLDGLDVRLQKYIDFENGFFVEAGANDGFAQSNTYWLERFRGWHGILIEPIPELYRICRRERPAAHVVNCALVARDYGEPDVTMRSAGLMSYVDGGFAEQARQTAHEQAARRLRLLSSGAPIRVPARTLDSVLDDFPEAPPIDLLSLDVEGYEPQVLNGFDLERHHPTWILLESDSIDAVLPVLLGQYEQVSQLSYHDYLFRYRNA